MRAIEVDDIHFKYNGIMNMTTQLTKATDQTIMLKISYVSTCLRVNQGSIETIYCNIEQTYDLSESSESMNL